MKSYAQKLNRHVFNIQLSDMLYFQQNQKIDEKGFTLIELLVVIAIMGILSSVVLASISGARTRAQDALRMNDMRQVQLALEAYLTDNGNYPIQTSWSGVSGNGGSRTISGVNAYIPGLTPTYISALPLDPLDVRTGWSGYLYRSTGDGSGYAFLNHSTGPSRFFTPGQAFYDPVRPTWAWKICEGGACAY